MLLIDHAELRRVRQVIGDGVGQHPVAISQTLHQGRSTEPVSAVIGEVGLTTDKQTRNGRLQVIVDPQATHRVVHRRVDTHGNLIRVLVGNPLVHVEEVAVLLFHGILTHTLDGLGEVEVHTTGTHVLGAVRIDLTNLRTDTTTLVTAVLGLTGCNVTRNQVAEGRVDALQVVVAIFLGDVARILFTIFRALGHPDTAVVTQRLRHQSQLRLVFTMHRDAGRVDLGVAGVAEVSALTVGTPRGGGIAAHGVRRQEKDVAVTTGSQDDGVTKPLFDLAGNHVTSHDAASSPVGDDELDHLVTGVHVHGAGVNLPLEGLVGADEQLLARLAASVEGALHLDATEGTVVEQATVLTGERNALGDTLVDDVRADRGEPVNVRLAGAVIATFDGVVEQAVDRITVILVVLRGVNSALGRDRVSATRRVLVAEVLDAVTGLTESCGGSATS